MTRTRKIPMAKRETAEQRSVTFSKRRQGLFNKAADLCRICDAKIAIIVTSAGSKEKVYTFGHSSVDAVFDRFLGKFPGAPEAAATDVSIKSASNSIYEEIKALEGDVKTLMHNKKRNVEGNSWDSFEELVQSSISVQELQEVVESMESLMRQAKNKLMINNSTGNLGTLSNVVEAKFDDFLALDFKPHDGSSSSLGDDQIDQNSAIVEYNSANYRDASWTTDGSPNNDSSDFPGEFTLDDIWNLIEYSDFSVDSDTVISNNYSNESPTSVTTASESASGSQENGDNVFSATEAAENGENVFSTTEAADYGFMDLLGEDDYCMTDRMGLPLVITDWTKLV